MWVGGEYGPDTGVKGLKKPQSDWSPRTWWWWSSNGEASVEATAAAAAAAAALVVAIGVRSCCQP